MLADAFAGAALSAAVCALALSFIPMAENTMAPAAAMMASDDTTRKFPLLLHMLLMTFFLSV
jgi:hypothetical protein